MGVNVVLVTSAVAAVAFGVFLRRRRRTGERADPRKVDDDVDDGAAP